MLIIVEIKVNHKKKLKKEKNTNFRVNIINIYTNINIIKVHF